MIIIPEIETVVILVPRTGSGSAKNAILYKYPKAMLLYRHMEADGIPKGYDRWEKVGVVRDPIERLWSLYKFLQNLNGSHPKSFLDEMKKSVNMSFNDWLINNNTVFTSPYASTGDLEFWPNYTVNHPLPENKKSQFYYLRPDLGTIVYQFSKLSQFESRLSVDFKHRNSTINEQIPALTSEARDHIIKFFKWDVNALAL